jgi:hypothetical protein
MTHTPDPTAAALETVIRDLLAENPALPIRADFYRGRTGNLGPLDVWSKYEHVRTPACGEEWFVLVKPNSFDVVVSVAGRLVFGEHDVIAVAEVSLPQSEPGVVDVEALSGSMFHVELLAVIREKAAVAGQFRAAVGA